MMAMVRRGGMCILVLFMLGLVVLMAAARHPEADSIKLARKNGTCEGSELYFAPVRGTVLMLCGIENTDQWGGLIWRVTENQGAVILSQGDAYEVTVFSAGREYWNKVIVRDGYVMLYLWPDVESAWRRYFQ